MKTKPPEATCCVCMKRKKCVTFRDLPFYGIRHYDNFLYSEEHCGWLCKPCAKKVEKRGVAVVSEQREFFEE